MPRGDLRLYHHVIGSCRAPENRRLRPAEASDVLGKGAGIVAGDVQFLRLPLCVHQSGPQPAKGFLRIGDGVEEQQVFLGDLLHLVFILSELPYLVEVFSIIHKGGEKICLNLSRHPDFCENFKKIAGFSEKRGKPRLFWQKISKRTEIFPAGTKLREKTGPPPADPSGIALQFSV